MTSHLKRTIFFFCCLYFGFGSYPGNQADAQDWIRIHIPSILSGHSTIKREISGYVLSNGNGLEDVGIYEGNQLLAVTNSQGYYKALLNLGFVYNLTPQKTGYQFTPPSRTIPGDEYNHDNQDFTAQKLALVTISGNVKWTNTGYVTDPDNPLPMVAMEAYAQEGSLFSRIVTDVDGNYSIPIPVGWTGWVKPFRLGFGFFPEKTYYYNLTEDRTKDYQAPYGDNYKITVSVKKPDGTLLPPNEQFEIRLDGINHAKGSYYKAGIVFSLGECSFSIHSGWIGDITPTNFGGGIDYTFNPASYRMSGVITSDMKFSFTAVPK